MLDNLEDIDEDPSPFKGLVFGRLAYWNRLVIHPGYRGSGLSGEMDNARMSYLRNNKEIGFAVAWAAQDWYQALIKLTFLYLGKPVIKFGGSVKQQEQFAFTLTNGTI